MVLFRDSIYLLFPGRVSAIQALTLLGTGLVLIFIQPAVSSCSKHTRNIGQF